MVHWAVARIDPPVAANSDSKESVDIDREMEFY